MRHPPGPACILCDSVAVAELAGNYLCAEHAVEAMEFDAGPEVEETTHTRT